jgi:hypothetical protein
MPAVDFSRQGLADLRTGLGDLVRELFRSNQQSSNQAFPTNPNRMNPIQGALNQRLGPIFSPYFRELANTPTGQPPGAQEQYLRDLSQVGNPMYRPPQGLQSTPLSYEGVGKLREARGLPPLGREYYEDTYLPYGI